MKKKLVVLFAWLALAGSARAQSAADDLEYNRRKFDVWRQYPDQLAKLREAAAKFAAQPASRREQLVKLDRDLAAEPSAVQARLQNTLDRYNDWLATLFEDDRDRILAAPDKESRLAIIKELRQKEWLKEQPKVVRDAIAALPDDEQPAALAKARAEDRQRHAEWRIARRFWNDLGKNKLPSRLSEFNDDGIKTYVSDVLMRLLTKDDRERLAKAEGEWPLYPQTLVELADKHPPALPSPDGPRSMADLPKSIRDSLFVFNKKAVNPLVKEKILTGEMKPFEGRYPEFAMKFTNTAHKNKWIVPFEWWAYNLNSLTPPMQEFVNQKMIPLLDRKEQHLLVNAEGNWPDYPETIQQLAQAHNLRVPWFTLPGPRERWDPYRAGRRPTVQGFPELPKFKLHDFVYFDLDDLDRNKFKNEVERTRTRQNLHAWTYLVDAYFQRYPSELARLRQIDREKSGVK